MTKTLMIRIMVTMMAMMMMRRRRRRTRRTRRRRTRRRMTMMMMKKMMTTLTMIKLFSKKQSTSYVPLGPDEWHGGGGVAAIDYVIIIRHHNMAAPGYVAWQGHVARPAHSNPSYEGFIRAICCEGTYLPIIGTNNGDVYIHIRPRWTANWAPINLGFQGTFTHQH